MKNRLVLISTHFNTKLYKKFAHHAQKKGCLVITFDDPKSSVSSCRERRGEVLEWIFSQIKMKVNVPGIEKIDEIAICIDFNVGHSGANWSPLKCVVDDVNAYNQVRLHFVKDREELEEVFPGITPVKLFLTGEGGAVEIACKDKSCEPMTKNQATKRYGYSGQRALENFSAIKAESQIDELNVVDQVSEKRSALLQHTLYKQKSTSVNERDPLLRSEIKERGCVDFIKDHCCTIL